jgi:hypothetical protein
MNNHYSPIWFDNHLSWQKKPRKVTSIKFEGGERLKYCKRCDDWHPADTEFFPPNKSKVGLMTWCRVCYSDHQNEKRYWHKSAGLICQSSELA